MAQPVCCAAICIATSCGVLADTSNLTVSNAPYRLRRAGARSKMSGSRNPSSTSFCSRFKSTSGWQTRLMDFTVQSDVSNRLRISSKVLCKSITQQKMTDSTREHRRKRFNR